MMFDLRVVMDNPLLVVALVVAMMSLKTLIGFGATFVMGHSWRVGLLTGVTLAQASEFSFVLSKLGFSAGILTQEANQLFLAVAILSMFVTPSVITLGRKTTTLLDRLIPVSWGAGRMGEGAESKKLDDHTIVVGYGVAGRNLVQALQKRKLPSMVIEYDPLMVRAQKKSGLNIIYGDASRPEVLTHAGLRQARNIVFTMSDSEVLLAAVEVANRLNPTINIIARARRASQVEDLKARGARSIVTEEIAGSMAISAQVLQLYSVPDSDIEETIRETHNN